MPRSSTSSTTSASTNTRRLALSAGEKKLVDIIRCLLLKPAVLLLDEPTAGLPDDVTEKVMEAVALARRGWHHRASSSSTTSTSSGTCARR